MRMTYSYPDNLPSIDSLTAAICAAKTGSFSAAAFELGITHAAISRRVAALEEWAGLKFLSVMHVAF